MIDQLLESSFVKALNDTDMVAHIEEEQTDEIVERSEDQASIDDNDPRRCT